MIVKLLLFCKIKMSQNASSILFAISKNSLPSLEINNNTSIIIEKYKLLSHSEFDLHVSKNFENYYLLECFADSLNTLPKQIEEADEKIILEWHTFPQTVKRFSSGKDKNFLQLAVQYISHGGIDQSVIAADFDQEFINTLKEKSEK